MTSILPTGFLIAAMICVVIAIFYAGYAIGYGVCKRKIYRIAQGWIEKKDN